MQKLILAAAGLIIALWIALWVVRTIIHLIPIVILVLIGYVAFKIFQKMFTNPENPKV